MVGSKLCRVRSGYCLDCPVVCSDENDLFIHHPVARLVRQARYALVEPCIVGFPQCPPAGVIEQRITGPDDIFIHPLSLQRGVQVGQCDFLGAFQHAPFVSGNINQDAAGKDWRDMLDAQFGETPPRADLRMAVAVVVAYLVQVPRFSHDRCHVTEGIKLRSILGDMPGDIVFVPCQPVVPQGTPGSGARNSQGVFTLLRRQVEQGHVFLEHPPHVIDLSLLDQVCRRQHLLRRQPVQRAQLIVRPPFRRPPFFCIVSRIGYIRHQATTGNCQYDVSDHDCFRAEMNMDVQYNF